MVMLYLEARVHPEMTKRVALFPNHPAQIWMLKAVADALHGQVEVLWVLRDKDVSVKVADKLGLDYILISRAGSGFVSNAAELAVNILRCSYLTWKYEIDLWVTKYGCGNIAAKLFGRKSISFNDDDADIVPLIAFTSYPFADCILAPWVTRMGRYEAKTQRYRSFHELFYLHPTRYKANSDIRALLGVLPDERLILVRLSALKAHHDVGIKGIGKELVRQLLERYTPIHRIMISAEGGVDPEFSGYALPGHAVPLIHDVLSIADVLICDSQTMASEAAVLGTPSIRVSDFVGRLAYLDELENYGLSFGFRPSEVSRVIEKTDEILSAPSSKDVFMDRRMKMLSDLVDPVPIFAQAILRVVGAL